MKKSHTHDSTFNVGSSKVFSWGSSKHIPRSVCDTERDRRQHRDPLEEEELQ
jgi:hypothetical protein